MFNLNVASLHKTKLHGNMNIHGLFPKEKRKDDSAFFRISIEISENISSWKEHEI